MKLLYLANARIPTEKAHGLQIMQNCEAFAGHGADVTLWAARRVNTAAMRKIADPWAYYGVERNFRLWRVPCLDVQWLVGDDIAPLRRGAFLLQVASYSLMLGLWLLFAQADIYYSRDLPTVLLLTLLKPHQRVAYEPHRLSNSGIGRWLQSLAVRRARAIFPITATMAATLIDRGADPGRVCPAHDGIRKARFENLPDQRSARRAIGWPETAFIVGYAGRLHTMSMDKGVSTLIRAIAKVDGASLGLVGGPDDMAEGLRREWLQMGLPAERFLYAGQVAPRAVPQYLSAFDVCAMPHPHTAHYATATSPLKLFEYMASQRPIVASDLPGWADVVADGDSALLVPPGDEGALANAIQRLRDDPALGVRLAENAHALVMAAYTWEARAQMILGRLGESGKRRTNMMTSIKRRLTRKLTRQQLQAFLERHATSELVLNVGAKKNSYVSLFPHTIAGDIIAYPELDSQLDAHRLPFAATSFATIVCTEVLEHCIEPQRVIDEFYRVLKPGGKLILSTRFVFPIHDAPHDYYRFTRYGLAHLCRHFDSVTIEPEARTVETLGILLQRLAAQAQWRLPGTKLLLQLAARVVFRLHWNLRAEYGDISKRASEAAIMASGYYLVAIKTLEGPPS